MASGALAAGAVVLAGPVAFVGLIAPHLARVGFGPAHARLLPASAVLGAALVVLADTAGAGAALAFGVGVIPLGVFTALIGGVSFLVVAARGGAGVRVDHASAFRESGPYHPGMTRVLLLANLVATLYLVGLIWFVQLVHYPLFDGVGSDGFAAYEARHTRWTGVVVAPAMLIELATAILLVWRTPAGVPAWVMPVGLAAVVVLWAVTFFVSVPQHTVLERGFDARAHRVLVDTNWIRTALWTARGALMLWVVGRLLPRG